MKMLSRFPLELIIWISVLVALASATPYSHLHDPGFTLCPLSNLGIKWCPGCGLGRSITNLFHGNIRESIKLHWLGIPALLLICARIVTLSQFFLKTRLKNNLN
jgi:hypothetical protein